MKQAIKDHSYTVVRLIVFQLAADILGYITSSAAGMMSASWVLPVSSVFCVCFYLFLVAAVCYEYGQKDGIRIESGKMQKKPWKFFVIGFFANSLNLLLAVFAVIGRVITNAPMSGFLTETYSPAWASTLSEVSAFLARALQTMYIGLMQSISDRNVILLLFIPIPAILTAGISYLVGIEFKDGFKNGSTKENKTDRYS